MATNSSIRSLFLDIGGVLLTNGWDQHMRRNAALKFGLDSEEMDSRHRMTFDTYEEGKLSLDTYLDRVVFYQKRSFRREEFLEYMFSQSRPFPKMINLLQQLKAKYHLKVVAVSNEGRELTEYRVHKFELCKLVDFFVSSCFVHLRKPDEDLYRLALDTAQVCPTQVVYIDDRKMFVEVAEKLKIPSIHHRDHNSTCSALEQLGLSLTDS